MILICEKCGIGLPQDETECPMCKLQAEVEELRARLHRIGDKRLEESVKHCTTGSENRELKEQVQDLKAELEKYKPKPLLFDTIGNFKVIISEEVPEGEIWFATEEQLKKALAYSAEQIEQALKGEKGT